MANTYKITGGAKLLVSRPVILSMVALILASCATKDPTNIAYGKSDVGIDEAFVLPSNRSVVGITQERASNAIIQTIALSTNSARSGENYFRVTFFGPVNSAGASENTLSYQSLTEGRISRELRTEMAGMRMVRSPYYVQNNYGPFSYATGTTSAGESCIYAWQQIRSPAHAQNFFQNRGRIDLRLRLCEAGASQEKLLASMYEFTINATIAASGWNPYGEPAGPSADIGRMGRPLMAPSVKSNLSGAFPASDLHTDRLNNAVSKVESTTSTRQMAPVTPRKSASQQRPEPDYYPPAQQSYSTSTYPQTPVVVPAPQLSNIAPAQQGTTPVAPAYAVPSTQPVQVKVPSPVATIAPQAAPTPAAVIVPSPCQLPSTSSPVINGASITVCP